MFLTPVKYIWKRQMHSIDLIARNTFRVRDMIFNATFNTISVISWRSVLLVEETGVPAENHRLAASH